MSVLSRVTAKTLKKNRVRTLVTIIGILLSASMFTAVAAIVTSFYDLTVKGEKSYTGDYHVCILRCDGARINALNEDERVYQNSVLEYMGYAGIDSANENKPYLSVIAANDSFFENMSIILLQGRLPENEGEILLPETLGYNGGVSLQPGDSMELALGERMHSLEGKLYQDSSFCEGERLDLSAEKKASYTVVGIYKRANFEKYSLAGYAALTRKNDVWAEGNYQSYFKVKSPSQNLDAVLESHGLRVFDELGNQEKLFVENHTLLALDGNLRDNAVLNAFLTIGAVVCLLIFAGSVSLIYNAFAISVSERTKQFGILASVGATKRQLRAGVFYEAFVLAIIAVPLGIGLGLLGTGLTLHFLKDVIANTGSHTFSDVQLTLSVSPWALLAAAALSFITVLVSAWVPSKRAMRISPMEAIRQTKDLKWKGNSLKSYKLFLKLFGTEGMLAKKYYQRSKKKYRTTIFSLAMSLVLFIGASAFALYAKKTASLTESLYGGPGFDLLYYDMESSDFESIRGELESFAQEVSAYKSVSSGAAFFRVDQRDMTDEYLEYVIKRIEPRSDYEPSALVFYMDDASFEGLLRKNGVEKNAAECVKDRTGLIVNSCICRMTGQDGKLDKIISFNILKENVKSLDLAISEKYTQAWWSGEAFGQGDLMGHNQAEMPLEDQLVLELKPVQVGALLDEAPMGIEFKGIYLTIIFPLSALNSETDDSHMMVYLRCADSQAAARELQTVMTSHGIPFDPSLLFDANADSRMTDNMLIIVNVFTYGFITLITLIAAANAFNTITTNVALRRRDYAMLRSIGMTKQGMNHMMNYECLLYGSRALLYGLPVAIGVTYLMYLGVADLTIMPFELPWGAILIAVVSIFLVVFVSMLYQTGKIKRDNLMEALRNENI